MLGLSFPAGWRRHAMAVRACFLGPDGRPSADGAVVLGRLAKFCHADRSTLKVSLIRQQVDPIASAAAEGRREVWLMLQQYLTLSEADVLRAITAHEAVQAQTLDTEATF